jgi:hypothetical protein
MKNWFSEIFINEDYKRKIMKKKISITIDEGVLAQLQDEAEKSCSNISRVISENLSVNLKVIGSFKFLNPYPEDIFTPMSSEDWQRVTQILQENGISPERVFGNWGRRVWDNCIDSILKEFQDQ